MLVNGNKGLKVTGFATARDPGFDEKIVKTMGQLEIQRRRIFLSEISDLVFFFLFLFFVFCFLFFVFGTFVVPVHFVTN